MSEESKAPAGMPDPEEKREAEKKKKKVGRKAAGAAVAFTAAVGVFFSSLFGSPNDLLADPSATEPPAIVMDISSDDEAEEEQETQEENTEKPGFFARICMMILRLPLFVRVAIGLPLWALGWLVTQAFAALWNLFLAPVAGHILTFLLMALVLLAVMTLLVKTAFPDLPLKEILSRPNILTVIVSCVLFCIFNIVMGQRDDSFARWEPLIRFGEGAFILLLIMVRMAFRKRKLAAAAV